MPHLLRSLARPVSARPGTCHVTALWPTHVRLYCCRAWSVTEAAPSPEAGAGAWRMTGGRNSAYRTFLNV